MVFFVLLMFLVSFCLWCPFVLGVLGVLVVLVILGVLALSVFDNGNMPAIQLIPREGLKSPYSYEGWIVVWSR